MSKTGVALAVLLACCSLVQAEKIDNPEYLAWANFEAGASVTHQMVTQAGEVKTEMTMTHTLKSINDEKAVVETVMVIKMQGNEMKQPPQTREIPAEIDKPAEPAEGEKPEVKEGEETVKVKAGTFKCKTVESTLKKDGQTTVTKIWTSEKVPGGQVKMEMKGEGVTVMKSTSELVAVKAGEADDDEDDDSDDDSDDDGGDAADDGEGM